MRNKTVLGLVFIGAAGMLAACATTDKSAAIAAAAQPAVPISSPADLPASGVIEGSYVPADQTDPNFEAARTLAIGQLYRSTGMSVHIASMKSEVQSVDGYNYRFNFVMKPDLGVKRAYQVIVHRDEKDALRVQEVKQTSASI